jgi:hypothetical protein
MNMVCGFSGRFMTNAWWRQAMGVFRVGPSQILDLTFVLAKAEGVDFFVVTIDIDTPGCGLTVPWPAAATDCVLITAACSAGALPKGCAPLFDF